jgi:regulator of sigma E protease
VRARPDQELTLLLQRDAGSLTVRVVPERRMETDPETKAQHAIGVVGVVAVHPMLKAPGLIGAVALGWRETTNKVSVILAFLKRPRVQELGGPLTIGEVSGQAARVGFAFFLSFMAFLSVNLAVLNLLPIPILDGGQVVFLVAELVRRRPLSVELRARLTQIGFVVLVSIMLIALRNDVLRVFPRVFGR